VDPALDAPGIPSSLSNAIRILLKARADKPMELEISSAATTDDIPIELAVRRGSCSEPTGRDIERWTSTSPSKPFTRKLRGIDIGTVETLHLVMGTAQPLAPVRCVDLAGPLGLQLAQNGALEFGRDCIAPLQLGSSTRVALTPESLQDQRCAAALEQLTSIVSGAVVAADQVTEAETCFSNIGVEARIEQLHDGSASVQLPDSLSPDDYDEAMRCLGIDPAPVGYAEATPADTDPSGENIR
jgi:hypothetical protein